MSIFFHEATKEFHLCNDQLSYLIRIMRNGQPGQLYFGERIPDEADHSDLLEESYRPTSAYVFSGEFGFSLEHLKQEYPAYGTTDFRLPAYDILEPDGSHITNFVYTGHKIYAGKPKLKGLPATYTENDNEADTLELELTDKQGQLGITLIYTIYNDRNVIARSVRFTNLGQKTADITRAMSISLDLPDADYDWLQFSGWWGRERHEKIRHLEQGVQSIGSLRGQSGHVHNPFVILKRPDTNENQGEAIGFSLVYSGNFIAQAEVDTFDVTRFTMGIHPLNFNWQLKAGDSFQTPEAVMAYSATGLNNLSQTFHSLYSHRLARGYWREKERPILINNWEATYFNFNEDKLLDIARRAQAVGIEMFVLDDGWFSSRRDDTSGLGDWWVSKDVLPNGISGLSQKIHALGLKFGLWFELEMANKDSEIYKNHPDWILHVPNRSMSHGRNQYVLDMANPAVIDYLYDAVAKILADGSVDYIKWDMNRSITECYSKAFPAEQQGEIFHRYILGVYELYERLTSSFPKVLFESCASGGGRFDAGLLYYAPQAWTSDDSDGIERLKIQYGTSFGYPISSMGAHVSITPNHQTFRMTPIKLRGDVAYFGAFGYELDLAKLSDTDIKAIKQQIAFVKNYRSIIHNGTFYRLLSPFEGNITAWMVVAPDKKTAIIGYYKTLSEVCSPYRRLKLQGLAANYRYAITADDKKLPREISGQELMHAGLVTTDPSHGEMHADNHISDFWSRIFILKAVD